MLNEEQKSIKEKTISVNLTEDLVRSGDINKKTIIFLYIID
tara:strand:+ start:1856 stop:1978 length:123 start_codon:yes stop_codon:yes gene_type:complete